MMADDEMEQDDNGIVINCSNADTDVDLILTQQGCCARFIRRLFPRGYVQELKELVRLAWPMFLSTLFMMLIPFTSILFCGHLGKIELDAVSLANTIINVTGLSVGIGLTTACDTLFSQTFGGSNKKQVGVYLQKALLILFLALFPCWAIHLNTENLLRVLGQHPEVSRLAGEYLLYFIPALFFNFIFQALSKYIQNQNIVIPSVVISIAANILNIFLNYDFVIRYKWGTSGSAIAQVAAHFALCSLTIVYILVSRVYTDTWGGWTKKCLMDWGAFLQLAFPGMLMVCLEWWCFEIGTILAGLLNEVELGAQSIVFQLEALVFMLPMGISIAVSIRVGQFLGAGDADGARTASRVSFTIIVVTSTVVAILIATLRDHLPKAFTSDNEVIERAAAVLPILAIFTLFDSTAAVCEGVLRGCGRQTVGAVVIFVGYYLLALPAGVPLLLFSTFKIEGLWIAYAGGIFVESVAFFLLVTTTNWQLEAEMAQMRACSSPVTLSPVPRNTSFQSIGEEDYTADETTDLLRRYKRRYKPTRRVSQPVGPYSMRRRYSSSNLITALHGRRFSTPMTPHIDQYMVPDSERRYSSKYVPSIQQVVSLQDGATDSMRGVYCCRLLALLAMCGILAGGVCLRLFVSVPYPWTTIPCLANTHLYNGTTVLPLCNTTGLPTLQ